MPHHLGKVIYRSGDQLQIIGEPYELFGSQLRMLRIKTDGNQ